MFDRTAEVFRYRRSLATANELATTQTTPAYTEVIEYYIPDLTAGGNYSLCFNKNGAFKCDKSNNTLIENGVAHPSPVTKMRISEKLQLKIQAACKRNANDNVSWAEEDVDIANDEEFKKLFIDAVMTDQAGHQYTVNNIKAGDESRDFFGSHLAFGNDAYLHYMLKAASGDRYSEDFLYTLCDSMNDLGKTELRTLKECLTDRLRTIVKPHHEVKAGWVMPASAAIATGLFAYKVGASPVESLATSVFAGHLTFYAKKSYGQYLEDNKPDFGLMFMNAIDKALRHDVSAHV